MSMTPERIEEIKPSFTDEIPKELVSRVPILKLTANKNKVRFIELTFPFSLTSSDYITKDSRLVICKCLYQILIY
jgi:hypothetical protein